MTEGADEERLAEARQFVVILRIVVESSGNVSGEIVGPGIDTRRRFVGIATLSSALRSSLDAALSQPRHTY